jgi:hypothetical protein
MEQELVDKIVRKHFFELTEQERSELSDWCSSEEEFNQLKIIFMQVEELNANSTERPMEKTKRSLDELFIHHHKKVAPVIWYNSLLVALYPKDKSFAQRPLIQVAAVALVLLMVYPFLFTDKLSEQKQQIAKVEEKKVEIEQPQEKIKTEKEIISTEDLKMIETVSQTNQDISMDMNFVADAEASEMIEDFTEKNLEEMAMPSAGIHPDGIFLGASAVDYSQSAGDEPAVLDLLTAAF